MFKISKFLQLVAAALAITGLASACFAEENRYYVDICSRTPAIQKHLVDLTRAESCAMVSRQQLGQIFSLDLRNLGLTEFHASDVADLPRMFSLILVDNPIAKFDFRGLSQNSPEINQVLFDGFLIVHLEPGAFAGLESVQSLDIQKLRVSDLAPGTFRGLKKLRWLTINGTFLKELRPGLLDDTPLLEEMTLAANDLQTIPAHYFAGLPNFRRLKIRAPLLNTVPAAFWGVEELELESQKLGVESEEEWSIL